MKRVTNLIQRVLFKFSNKYTMSDILSKDLSSFTKGNQRNIRLFKKKGCECVSCGRKGHYFIKKGNAFTLYSKDNVLMTKDHIYPKSKGGPNNLYNLQTMCYDCNSKKANIIPEDGTYLKINCPGERQNILKKLRAISKLEKKESLSINDKEDFRKFMSYLYKKKLLLVLFEDEIEKFKKIPLNTLEGIRDINILISARI